MDLILYFVTNGGTKDRHGSFGVAAGIRLSYQHALLVVKGLSLAMMNFLILFSEKRLAFREAFGMMV